MFTFTPSKNISYGDQLKIKLGDIGLRSSDNLICYHQIT